MLILDETSNHLDLEMIEWLEQVIFAKEIWTLFMVYPLIDIPGNAFAMKSLEVDKRANCISYRENYSY